MKRNETKSIEEILMEMETEKSIFPVFSACFMLHFMWCLVSVQSRYHINRFGCREKWHRMNNI